MESIKVNSLGRGEINRNNRYPALKKNTNYSAGNRGLDSGKDISSFMMNENSGGGERVRRGEEVIVGNGDRRRREKCLLETDNRGFIRREEMAKVMTVGAETAKIPVKNGHELSSDKGSDWGSRGGRNRTRGLGR